MAILVSTVDTKLVIPKNFQNFENEKPLTIELKANIPKNLDDRIVNYYTTNRPQQFKRLNEDTHQVEDEVIVAKIPTIETEEKKFNAEEFLENNSEILNIALKELKRTELMKICSFLKFKNITSQSNERLIERIFNFVETSKDTSEAVNSII